MVAELGILSLTELQKFAQFQPQQSQPTIWKPRQVAHDDDNSWEVKAFEQDTSNITWPPRSYTCTFCRREFRSAQALGGHMNVHRRDRARLHQAPPCPKNPTSPSASSPTLLIPPQQLVTNNGVCFVYPLPNPNADFTSSCWNSPYKLLSASPFPASSLIFPSPSANNSPMTPHSNDLGCRSCDTELSISSFSGNLLDSYKINKDLVIEELDLELRLGHN